MNAHLRCQFRSIGCCRLPNGCQLHCHAADSVLTSGCSFISQQIWITIFMELAIHGISIKIATLSTRKRSMDIHIPGWHTIGFRDRSCLIFNGWHRWCCGWMWHRFWGRVSETLQGRCTCALVPPAWLAIVCYAIVPTEEAVRLISSERFQVSVHRSIHIFMPRKPNSPLLLISDFGTRLLDEEWCVLYRGARKHIFGHCSPIQGKAHVRLF